VGAVRVSPIRVNDEFAVLTGVSPGIFQELQVAVKSGSGKGFQKVLDECRRGDAGCAACRFNLRNLLR